MINVLQFEQKLKNLFENDKVKVFEFKDQLHFVEVDCFPSKTYKLSIEITDENIKLSSIEKETTLDFSLHDYIFVDEQAAISLLERFKAGGEYSPPNARDSNQL